MLTHKRNRQCLPKYTNVYILSLDCFVGDFEESMLIFSWGSRLNMLGLYIESGSFIIMSLWLKNFYDFMNILFDTIDVVIKYLKSYIINHQISRFLQALHLWVLQYHTQLFLFFSWDPLSYLFELFDWFIRQQLAILQVPGIMLYFHLFFLSDSLALQSYLFPHLYYLYCGWIFLKECLYGYLFFIFVSEFSIIFSSEFPA